MSEDALAEMLSEGAPAISFADDSMVNKWVKGLVIDVKKTQQTRYKSNPPVPLFFDEEKTRPMWQYVFTLQTEDRTGEDDDGMRRLYAKGQMIGAIAAELRKAGVTSTPDAAGGLLAVRWTGYGEAKDGMNPPKLYEARFKVTDATTDLTAEAPEPAPEPEYDAGEEPF